MKSSRRAEESINEFLDGAWRDVVLAWRALRATPIVTLVAAGSLALGIGANTAIFSVLNSLLLRTLPVHDPSAHRGRRITPRRRPASGPRRTRTG